MYNQHIIQVKMIGISFIMYKIIVFEYIRLWNILQHENGLNIADDIVFYKGITWAKYKS